MSFLSVLKDIGKFALGADKVAAPIVSIINPAAGSAMSAIAALVVKAEQTFTEPKAGPQKKAAVTDWFFMLLPMFQEILKEQAGLQFTFDAQAVSELIDAQVAALNAAAKLKASFKVERTAPVTSVAPTPPPGT